MNRQWPSEIQQAEQADIQKLDEVLTTVIAALLQQSNKKARIIVGVATSQLVAAGITAGVFGAVGLVGVASTGTAIATLSGAAATTATLYWIGSTIGLGVATGGVILAGGALAAAVPAAIVARRQVFGRPRKEDQLNKSEQAVLYASLRLASALRLASSGGNPPTRMEMQIVSKQALRPLVRDIKRMLAKNQADGDTDQTCAPQRSSLAFRPRLQLRSAVKKLNHLSERFEAM